MGKSLAWGNSSNRQVDKLAVFLLSSKGGLAMYKFLATEIIARGMEAEDKAWRQKQAQRRVELGLGSTKVYSVFGREVGRVLIEMGETESWDQAMEWMAMHGADEVLQALEQERAEKGIVVEGSFEVYILTDY
jgi:hypothetical protein